MTDEVIKMSSDIYSKIENGYYEYPSKPKKPDAKCVNGHKHEVISVIVTKDGVVDEVENFFLPTNLKDIERDKIIREAENYFMERIHDIFGVISLDRSDVLADGLYIDSNENGNVITVNLVWSVIEIF